MNLLQRIETLKDIKYRGGSIEKDKNIQKVIDWKEVLDGKMTFDKFEGIYYLNDEDYIKGRKANSGSIVIKGGDQNEEK